MDTGDARVKAVLAVFLALRLTRVEGHLWLKLDRGEVRPSIGNKLRVRVVNFRFYVDGGFNLFDIFLIRRDIVFR